MAFLLLVIGATSAIAQVTGSGTSFWACWPRSHLSLETSAELIVMADRTTMVAVDGAFSAPAASVGPGAPLIIPIPATMRIAAQRTIVPAGFRVRSLDVTKPISVLLRVPRQAEASDDIARLLPDTELGTDYLVTSYPAALPGEPSFYAVIATEDGTTVDAEVPCAAGALDTVLLDQGEVYQVFCEWTDSPPDVTGARVRSDRPVVVLAGSSDAYVPVNWLSGDFVVESMVPVASWGREFVVAPLPKGPGADPSAHDVVRVVSSGAGTLTVEDAGGTSLSPLAGSGAVVDLAMTSAMRLSADVGVSVHLFACGVEMTDLGDPFMVQVPPVSDHATGFRIHVPPAYMEGSWLTVVTTATGTADVLLNGQPITAWSPAPGGAHAWAQVSLGLQGPEHLLASSEPSCVLVHGYNDAYQPDPTLGRVPGSYGYPAPRAEPPCLLFARAGAPPSACDGLSFELRATGTTRINCAAFESRWLREGVPIPGCDTFTDVPTCTTTFTGAATYQLEVRCVGDPACTSQSSTQVLDLPAPPIAVAPDPVTICPSGMVALDAGNGFVWYSWTSDPPDPGVTPQDSALSTIVISPDGPTTYTVVATDIRGCTTSDSILVRMLPDPIPSPVADSLRVTKSRPTDLRLRWTDLVGETVADYEVVALACPTRTDCAGAQPDPVTIQASPRVGGAVVPGTQTTLHRSALVGLGGLIFYNVRATSPCTRTPGPTCNGWPMQVPPCP